MTKHVFLLGIISMIILISGQITPASSQLDCAVKSDYSFYLLNFDAVFIGTTVNSTMWDANKDWQNIQFKIEFPVKGIDKDQSTVDIITSENNDGFQFHVGSKYLVHAGKAYDVDLFTGICSNNKMLSTEDEVTNQLSKIDNIRSSMSPLRQIDSGVSINDVSCSHKKVFVIKNSDGSPACVFLETKEKLIQRGWAVK